MRVYDIDFRPGGRIEMEIPKAGVTAPEIMLLRYIHGDDAVKNVQPRKMDRRSHVEELERLKGLYNLPNAPQRVERFFGILPGAEVKLPVALSAAELQEIEAAGGVEAVAKAEAREAAEGGGKASQPPPRGKLGLGPAQAAA